MVHISQFYPCSYVTLAAELYYICELGKYSKLTRNVPVSLDGVVLSSVLKNSPIWHYFRIAVEQEWVGRVGNLGEDFPITPSSPLRLSKTTVENFLLCLFEPEIDREDYMRRRNDWDYDIRTPERMMVSLEERTDAYWLWSIGGEGNRHSIENNKVFNRNRADQAWLSFIAMVAVERFYRSNKPRRLYINLGTQTVVNELALSYLMLLYEETQCFNSWVEYQMDSNIISPQKQLHLGYVTWYVKGRDYGMCNRFYTQDEKYMYARGKFDLMRGDLVMLYSRAKAQRSNYVKSILDCHLAVIRKFTKTEIVCDCISTVKTRYQGKLDFEDNTMAVKKMYMGIMPYESLRYQTQTLSLLDVGIEYMLYNEGYFIVPLDACTDVSEQWVTNGVTSDKLLLPQNDLIYWILKDYDVQFNEQRFLARYFSKSEPLYTRYMRGETLEDCYYAKEAKKC